MGIKGDKQTVSAQLAAEKLLEKLGEIKGVTNKRMFGGYGIFHNDKLFGMIDSKGNYSLKTNDSNKPDYEAKGSHKHSRMPYFSIPEEVLESSTLLKEWADKAILATK
jgi:DNA transformation protein